MKWETSDINVVERSNTEKFSKIDNVVTALRLLELLFHDALVDMIVGHTKLYSHREKTDISFEITNEKSRLFLSMLLLRVCHKLPDHKMYWETTPDTSDQTKSDSMSRNTFVPILQNSQSSFS